jgi:hypothetical protein
MPLDTKPEDFPAAVRFSVSERAGGLDVTCALLPERKDPPYRVEGGNPHFESRDAFKAKVVYVGLTPAVAEDHDRSFNATARQLRELGFLVEVESEKEPEEEKAA